MTYIYKGWNLFKKNIKLGGGSKHTIYFFCKRKPKSGTKCDKPKNMIVGVNKRTGLPYLKKNKK